MKKTITGITIICSTIIVFFIYACGNNINSNQSPTSNVNTSVSESDESTNQLHYFIDGGKLKVAKHYHLSILMQDGKVLISGGYDDNGNPLSSAEIYDPISKNSNLIGNMKVGRTSHQGILLLNGNVLLVGGSSTDNFWEIFNVTSQTFQTLSSSPYSSPVYKSITGFAITLLKDGRVMISGGETFAGLGYRYAYEVRDWIIILNPLTNELTAGVMVRRRKEHSATLLPSGKVLIIGGYDGSDYLNSAEIYDPITNTSQEITKMYYERMGHSATLVDSGDVIIVGGYAYRGSIGPYLVSSPEKYNIDSDKFDFIASGSGTGIGLYRHFAVYLPYYQKIYIIGGSKSTSLSWNSMVYILDLINNKILELENLTNIGVGASVVQLSDTQFMVSGGKDIKALDSIKIFTNF